MKNSKSTFLFLGGLLTGIALACCVGAADKPAAKPVIDWSRLKISSYSSGVTSIFDPASGRLYMYDANLVNCYMIRELTELGEPLTRLRN